MHVCASEIAATGGRISRRPAIVILGLGCLMSQGCGRDARRTTAQTPPVGAATDTPVATMAGPVMRDTGGVAPPSPHDRGAMRIVFTSAGGGALGEFIATLLLTDPRGRRSGVDVASGDTLQQIPGAWYDDEVIEDPEEEGSGAATRGIEITAPEPGAYALTVHATAPGTYDLSIRGYDRRLEPSERTFTDVAIRAGDVHTYGIGFSLDSGITRAERVGR